MQLPVGAWRCLTTATVYAQGGYRCGWPSAALPRPRSRDLHRRGRLRPLSRALLPASRWSWTSSCAPLAGGRERRTSRQMTLLKCELQRMRPTHGSSSYSLQLQRRRRLPSWRRPRRRRRHPPTRMTTAATVSRTRQTPTRESPCPLCKHAILLRHVEQAAASQPVVPYDRRRRLQRCFRRRQRFGRMGCSTQLMRAGRT
mmetsp:Transcript_5245/g.17306  ORF Transcript_5245/g.17306 Transcript_5245/m.17306 type:complete len:200 (+) Transcript_5245:1795-2394(+)